MTNEIQLEKYELIYQGENILKNIPAGGSQCQSYRKVFPLKKILKGIYLQRWLLVSLAEKSHFE